MLTAEELAYIHQNPQQSSTYLAKIIIENRAGVPMTLRSFYDRVVCAIIEARELRLSAVERFQDELDARGIVLGESYGE